jgi:chromate transporter
LSVLGEELPPAADGVLLREIFTVFSGIGLSSFGGGLSGWMYRELVERRAWITPHDFLTGLSLARAMPGTNVINLAIWIGYHLRRTPGALTAVFSVLFGPMIVIFLLASIYARWGQSPQMHQVLIGVAAAGIGLSLSMGLRTLRVAAHNFPYAVIAALAFGMTALLHLSIVITAAFLVPLSLLWTFYFDVSDEK